MFTEYKSGVDIPWRNVFRFRISRDSKRRWPCYECSNFNISHIPQLFHSCKFRTETIGKFTLSKLKISAWELKIKDFPRLCVKSALIYFVIFRIFSKIIDQNFLRSIQNTVFKIYLNVCSNF